ncbi:MAG TPA: Crp/Fnr family transcriptional regulator, partial [Thermoanaerobaculia bacterium]|nr:Crp/Fnr family transcriptional regulator [Thermoanaerobaculia bacterium]
FPPDALRHMEGAFRTSELMVSDSLFGADDRTDLYFPLDGVISILRTLESGAEVEVGMIGPDGFAGINALLGVETSPHHGLVQGRGWVARIDPEIMRNEMQQDRRVSDVLLRFVHAFYAMTTQLAACNRVHLLDERLAHWLLILADRVGAPEMSVTQEFLSRMLGARRAGINEGIRHLREAGAIEHSRNRVRIIDRPRLEELSCECYAAMREDYERALGFPPLANGRITDVD